MEYSKVLEARRSVRRFDDRPIAEPLLQRVLAAGPTMPHGGNTYDWRGIVLRREHRDRLPWPEIHEALFRQSYVEEAPVVVVWTVQPRWWREHYEGNIRDLLDRGLLDEQRAGDLLSFLGRGGPDEDALLPALVGEAMLGVAAVMLTAFDEGLGGTLSGCRPGRLAAALGLPEGVVVAPFGVLALGYPADEPSGRAAKPGLADLYFDGAWGEPLAVTP